MTNEVIIETPDPEDEDKNVIKAIAGAKDTPPYAWRSQT